MPEAMALSRDKALSILRTNLGFGNPDDWVDYAMQYDFKQVSATPITTCPDCGSSPRGDLGQYVYYSTLIRLLRCRSCDLIWADAHIDPDVVRAHFEVTYKDRDYFLRSRAEIFGQLVGEISRLTPQGGGVLDIGGAQGDLMHLLRAERPDITPVVHDLSPSAVRYATEHFGLETICGDF